MTSSLRERVARLLGRKPPDMQVAALCLNRKDGRILLVTSRGTGRWIVPKGWPMPGKSLADAAMQEAWEEAGARGTIDQTAIGSYHYDKHQAHGFAIPVEVRAFVLNVEDLADDFPEASERKRRWFSAERAAELVSETGLKRLLLTLPLRTGSGA